MNRRAPDRRVSSRLAVVIALVVGLMGVAPAAWAAGDASTAPRTGASIVSTTSKFFQNKPLVEGQGSAVTLSTVSNNINGATGTLMSNLVQTDPNPAAGPGEVTNFFDLVDVKAFQVIPDARTPLGPPTVTLQVNCRGGGSKTVSAVSDGPLNYVVHGDASSNAGQGPLCGPGTYPVGYRMTVAAVGNQFGSGKKPKVIMSGNINDSAKRGMTLTNCAQSVFSRPADTSDVGVSSACAASTAINAPIGLQKTADKPTVSNVGETVTYTFTATNNTNLTLNYIRITDPMRGLSRLSCSNVRPVEPGRVETCTATYKVTRADLDAGKLVNTATAEGRAPNAPLFTDSATTTVGVRLTGELRLSKTADLQSVKAAGEKITYDLVATNGTNVTLHGVSIIDPKLGALSCAQPVTLAPGASLSCKGSWTATQSEVDAGSVENKATATGTPPPGLTLAPAEATATVAAEQAPLLALSKTASPSSVSAPGPVTYTFTVSNKGNVNLSGIVVSDPLPGLSPVSCPAAALAPGASMGCTATYEVTQDDIDEGGVSNTASVSGNGPGGPVAPATASANVTVSSGPSIDLRKDAEVEYLPLGRAGQTITYSFTVSNPGNVTLTGVAVTDALLGGPVACPAERLAPGDSMRCTADHTVTQADIDRGYVTNDASVVGTPPAGPNVASTASVTVTARRTSAVTFGMKAASPGPAKQGDTVTFAFVLQNTGNVTLTGVTISDPTPAMTTTCGTSPVTLAPRARLTCAGTYVVQQSDVESGGVTGAAKATAVPPAGAPALSEGSLTATAAVPVVRK